MIFEVFDVGSARRILEQSSKLLTLGVQAQHASRAAAKTGGRA